MTRKYKSLQEEDGVLALQWHINKNGELTPNDVSFGSSKKVWWQCAKGHEWEMLVSARSIQDQGCPYCANKRACEDNCLCTKYPELSKEWDYIKNIDLTPQDVLPHSYKKVWWICSQGHSFNAWIGDRVNGVSHCTQCKGYTIRDRKSITNGQFRICKKCKEELDFSLFRIKKDKRSGTEYIDNVCKECSTKLVDKYRKTEKGIAAEIVRRTKHVCKKNNLPFDLDKKWVFARLNSINWQCELTGLPMKKNTSGGFVLDSISVDRIIPENGYTKNNIRFVLNQVNIFRQNGSDDNMYIIAQALLDYRKIKNG